MHAEGQLVGPRPQERVVSVSENLPLGGTKASAAIQFDAHPIPTKEEYEQNKNMYVLAKGTKQVIPTLTTAPKAFELSYKEPLKIRLPHIVTSEPSSISATLHISVEPLSGSSKDDLPQIRIFDRAILGSPFIASIPFKKYWDADLQNMLGSPTPFEYEQLNFPDVGSPYMNKLAPQVPLKNYCSCLCYPCRKENLNTNFLTSSLGIHNVLLIAGLCVLTFYGLPATESAYTTKMVAITAWTQMTSQLIVFVYKAYCTTEVLELPKLYESIHLAGTFILMVVSATMFFGVHDLPEDSWHMSILCVGIALIALNMMFKI